MALVEVLTPGMASANGRDRPLDLEWVAPVGCPAGEEVVARVEDLIGGAWPSALRSVSARGRVTASPTTDSARRYRLDLVVVGNEANQRTMSGDDCSHLVDAAALILALDIDPDALTRRGDEPAALEPPQPANEAADTGPPVKALPQRDPPRATAAAAPPKSAPHAAHLQGGARIVLDDGSLPRTTLGVGPVLAIAHRQFVLELQGTVYREQFTVAGPRGGHGGAYVALSTLGAHACGRGAALEVEWRGCLGGEIGVESTTGVSVAQPETASGLWSAASAMLGARLPSRRVSPTAGLAIAHPFVPPPVFIGGFGTIFEAAPVVVRAFLGVDVILF